MNTNTNQPHTAHQIVQDWLDSYGMKRCQATDELADRIAAAIRKVDV